jgi:formate dehydrogenase major subunit
VQVTRVMQPSAWQQEYSRFNETQQALLTAAVRDDATVGAK